MELVEGEDLAGRLERGAIPVDEAVAVAKQVAEALEAAHEKGIAHTGTAAGLILGTAAYMSPEQARGKAVDKRADIWAFGVLLFEMLTGRRLFDGETVSDTLAAVLTREIDRGILARLAQGAVSPLWSPDGEWIVFGDTRKHDIARVRADGSRGPEPLLTRERGQVPSSISPDGKLLAFAESTSETGRDEVYVQPFPGPGAKRQVSVGGGTSPVWGRQQGEIFYQRGTEIMAVSVRTGASLHPAPPRKVADGAVAKTTDDVMASWDLGPGGQGFVMPRQLEQKQASTLMVTLGWTPTVARRGSPRD